jgi:hypothetical protein
VDSHIMYDLFVRGHQKDRNTNNSLSGRSKFKGRSKYPRKSLRKCKKCGKLGNYKKDCRSKKFDKAKVSDDSSSSYTKTCTEE